MARLSILLPIRLPLTATTNRPLVVPGEVDAAAVVEVAAAPQTLLVRRLRVR